MSGQAASYYNPGQSFGDGQPHPQQQPVYNNNFQPPNQNYQYDAGYHRAPEPKPPQGAPPTYNQAVYGFDEAFKLEKPKFNDIWAGLLVC